MLVRNLSDQLSIVKHKESGRELFFKKRILGTKRLPDYESVLLVGLSPSKGFSIDHYNPNLRTIYSSFILPYGYALCGTKVLSEDEVLLLVTKERFQDLRPDENTDLETLKYHEHFVFVVSSSPCSDKLEESKELM